MSKIKILNNEIINQIAAGEVVDRPAHMVKELCENSIDAGATEISVDFRLGGKEVSIRDNGCGIHKTELELSLARHSTSKINKSEDLWNISSYGFRGEALASIGAVSQLQIISRTQDQSMGAQIENDFGQSKEVTDIGAEYGTLIVVKDLFKNIPARFKFLKSDVAESVAIKNQLKALALANPHIEFRILQNGELLFFWPRTDSLLSRVQNVFENNDLYYGEASLESFKARVVVSSPNDTVKNSRQIWLFVRGRYVQDRSLQTAVLEAYRNLLMHGEYPSAAVFLDCDPQEVDVNVSPTKSQVKFRNSSDAFRVVQRAVRQTLESAPWLKGILNNQRSSAEKHIESEQELQNNFTLPIEDVNRIQHEFRNHNLTSPFTSSFAIQNTPSANDMALDTKSSSEFTDANGGTESSHNSSEGTGKWANLEVIGQAHQTYIITQKSDAVIFVDQHAAHERVLFEKLLAGFKNKKIEVQNFLLAPTVELSEELAAELIKNRESLETLGLYLDQMSPTEIAINAAPALVNTSALTPLLEKIANEYFEKGGSFSLENKVSHIIATMACHSAIRAGQTLGFDEMRALLKQMDEFPLSSFCPHGRPVFVEYPIHKLERDFGRIV